MKPMLLCVALLTLSGAVGAQAMHAGEGLPVVSNGLLSVSAQASVGLLNGTAQENVYYSAQGDRQLLSQLDWDLHNVVLVGAEISVVLQNYFWVNAGLWGAATQGGGQMTDSDWLLEQPGSPWTDWSLSSVDVTRAWLLDLNINFEMTRFGALGLRGIAGYKYNTWRWEDHGIQHIYSSNPTVPGGFRNDVAADSSETGIIYEQDFHIPYIGVGLNYARGPWNLDAFVLYSPYVIANDNDQHLIRNLDFKETFTGGEYIGLGLRGTYTFPYNFFATLALDGQIIPEIYGDQSVTDTLTGQTDTTHGTAGLNNQVWMLSLALGRKF